MNSLVYQLLVSARRSVAVSLTMVLVIGGLEIAPIQVQAESLVGQPIRVPLTVSAFDERSPNFNLSSYASHGIQALKDKPAGEIKSEPKLQNPTYYRLKIGSREILAILDVGKDAENARLYIDLDGRGLLGDATGVAGVDQVKANGGSNNDYAFFKFGPVTLPKNPEAVAGPVEVTFSCSMSKKNVEKMRPYLRLSPQKYVTGKLPLGSGEYTVAFVDGAFIGKFEPLKLSSTGAQSAIMRARLNGASTMAIDLNKNGMFDWQGEISPLVGMVRIDGKYYNVSVTPDGSEAAFQEAKPQLGVLDTQCPGMELFVVSDQCAALLTPNSDGKWELPVGKYAAGNFVLTRTDEGIKWTLDGAQPGPAMQNVEVKAGTPTLIPLGPPLALTYTVRQVNNSSTGTVSIGMNLTGKSGESYSAGAQKDHRREPEPKFAIQSETGEKLTEGNFQYG